MKKRKAELYEILASNSAATNDESVRGKIYPENSRVKSFAKSRSGREIVFSLDGAFIIFVVILLLIGTAFFLGYRKGASEVKASFVRNVRAEKNADVNTLRLVNEYTPPLGSIDIPNGKYSLKLISLKRSDANYRKLVEIKNTILSNALVASSKLHLFIFDKGKGGVYSLAIGLFDKTSDEMLMTMKEYFKNYSLDGKNPTFNNFSVERVEDLGEAKIEN